MDCCSSCSGSRWRTRGAALSCAQVSRRFGVDSCAPAAHQAGHREAAHRFGAVWVGFVVAGEAAVGHQPAEDPLDTPSPGDDLEALLAREALLALAMCESRWMPPASRALSPAPGWSTTSRLPTPACARSGSTAATASTSSSTPPDKASTWKILQRAFGAGVSRPVAQVGHSLRPGPRVLQRCRHHRLDPALVLSFEDDHQQVGPVVGRSGGRRQSRSRTPASCRGGTFPGCLPGLSAGRDFCREFEPDTRCETPRCRGYAGLPTPGMRGSRAWRIWLVSIAEADTVQRAITFRGSRFIRRQGKVPARC